MSIQECHEEVSRRGEQQPCDRRAVGWRTDEEGIPYPVCKRHFREPYHMPRIETGFIPGDRADGCIVIVLNPNDEDVIDFLDNVGTYTQDGYDAAASVAGQIKAQIAEATPGDHRDSRVHPPTAMTTAL